MAPGHQMNQSTEIICGPNDCYSFVAIIMTISPPDEAPFSFFIVTLVTDEKLVRMEDRTVQVIVALNCAIAGRVSISVAVDFYSQK
jgi:hypothetical protein